MRDIKNLTVLVCSYKANKEFKLCLHQLARYGFSCNQLLVYENSPNDYLSNRETLNAHGIRYINNPDGMHAASVNQAFMNISTDYVLLLDSDCFMIVDPIPYFERVKSHGIQLYGDICGDRAGLHIHKRVHPWWCFIDLAFLKKNNIQFVDFNRMAKTDSMSFIDKKLLSSARDPKKFYYDAGSTMYEDVIACGGVIADVGESKPYIHIEGASWRRDFEGYAEIVAAADNWTNLLYPKLLFDEKYLDLLAYTEPAEESVKLEKTKVDDAVVVEPQLVEENNEELTEEKAPDEKSGKKKIINNA